MAVAILAGADPDDGLRAWLSQPPAARQAGTATPDRWLAAYLAVLAEPAGAQRLRLAEQALGRQPPGLYEPYLRLERAAALSASGRHADAIAAAQAVRDGAADQARLRYEACRVLATALAAGGRRDEAAACRREAEDLARRVLYADPGVAGGAAARDRLADADPAAWYREAESQRAAGAWTAAARWYRQVQERCPDHRLAAASAVGLGWCQVGDGSIDDAERTWRGLLDQAADGPFRGQALLGLIDVALEERADLVRATSWVERIERILAAGTPADGSWEDMPRQASLRRILVLLARGEGDAARQHAARLLAGPGDDDATAQPASGATFVPARGVGRLLERLAGGNRLTPPEALSPQRPAASLRLLLADAWIALGVAPRARRHLGKVLEADAQASVNQRIYAIMRGADLDRTGWKLDAFRAGYQRTLELAPRHPWRCAVRLALAVDAYGRMGDEAGAIAALERLCQDAPASPEAQTAAWYLGLIPLWAGRWAEAEAAFAALDRRFPAHPWREIVDGAYRPMLREARRTGAWPTGWPDPRPPAEALRKEPR